MLIEIHMLKNFPPVNLNRDDTNAPKTALFGGVTRGRISSQCLKRSWRTSPLFQTEVGAENLGIRTRKLPQLVADELLKMGVDPEYVKAVEPRLSGFGNKEGKETKEGTTTAQVIFFAPKDIQAVAETVKASLDKCKTVKDVAKLKASELQAAVKGANVRPITLDIALFGRMVTSNAFRDVEACMQVAHAISTNKVATESDYFTAMDDLLGSEDAGEAGAAMIGDVDYNACCYYIYAALDVDALKKSLDYSDCVDDLVKKAVPALIRTMAFTNPSGKQNSFGGHILPSAVYVECKEQKVPTNLVNAFAVPVAKADVVKSSISALAEEADMMVRNFGLEAAARLWFCVDKYDTAPACATKKCASLQELVNEVAAMI